MFFHISYFSSYDNYTRCIFWTNSTICSERFREILSHGFVCRISTSYCTCSAWTYFERGSLKMYKSWKINDTTDILNEWIIIKIQHALFWFFDNTFKVVFLSSFFISMSNRWRLLSKAMSRLFINIFTKRILKQSWIYFTLHYSFLIS